jgi:hypothetical protein
MVMYPKYFSNHKFVYISDADILILRTNPTLIEVHLDDLTGPFSNSIRNASNIFKCGNDTWNGTECLSGLHFCTKSWFDQVEPLAAKYREFLKTAEVGRGFDGRMLWLMCKKLGFPIPGKKKLIKRHHGIHIGTFRLWDEGKPYINRPGAAPMTKEQAEFCIHKRVKSYHLAKWKEYMRDPEYEAIVGRMHNPEVISYVRKLEAYARLH